MVGGFNTNVRYRGRILHVQTEDSGQEHPHIVTLLYEGGAILFSKKQSYEDRVAEPNLEPLVRDLMEAQHREMVRRLKDGGFDDQLGVASGAQAAPDAQPQDRQVVDFGQGIIGDRSLDELILAHLASS